jgi:hypothetical protein
MLKWIKNINKEKVIRNSFLLPILLVVAISISHVVSWYDMGNPMAWAIYLSVAIEIFALASIAAASINASRVTIWFLFGVVTFIQIIGNVFFSFNYIDVDGELFASWIDLVGPLFMDWDSMDHRRFLAAVQGGSLPIMSLTALHFYLKFNDKKIKEQENNQDIEKAETEALDDYFDIIIDEKKEETPINNEAAVNPTAPDPKKLFSRKSDDEDYSKYNPQE